MEVNRFIERSALHIVDDDQVDAIFERLEGVSDGLFDIDVLFFVFGGRVYLAPRCSVGNLRLRQDALELAISLATMKLLDFAAYDMFDQVAQAKIVSPATVLWRRYGKIIQQPLAFSQYPS